MKRTILGKLLRSSAFAAFFGSVMALTACQNSADPDPKPFVTAEYRVPAQSLLPDSSAWSLRGITGNAPFTQSPGTTQLTSVFEVPSEPAADTLFLTNWASGLKLARFAFTGYNVMDPIPGKTTWFHPAREILERRDSLASIDPKFFASNNQGARRAYADGLVSGDAKFTGYASNRPVGIDSSALLDDIAIAMVRRKLPFANIIAATYLDSSASRSRLVALHNAKSISDEDFAILFPTAPVRVVANLAMDSLLANGGAMTVVTGRFYAQQGVDNLTFSVLRNGLDATDLFKVTDGVVLVSDPKDVDLAGKVFLETKATTPAGTYELQAVARDPQGYQVVAKRSFQVFAAPDRIGPDIKILWPATGTMLDNAQTTTAVKAQIDDLSGVDSVRIDGQSARFDGKFWSVTGVAVPETDQGYPIAVVAKDRLGNSSTSVVMVGRKLSPFTANAVLSPAQGTVLPYDSASVKVRWKIRSRIGLGDTGVVIGGYMASRESDSVWSARIPLSVGANTISLKAVDAQGNWTTNSVSVTRQARIITVIRVTPKQDTVVSASTTSLRVSWRVPGADTVCINGNCSISQGADSAFSSIVSLQAGVNIVKMQSWTYGGYVSDSIRITRSTSSDTTRPVIVRDTNTRSQTVSNSTSSIWLAWAVTDASALAVRLNDSLVGPVSGMYRKNMPLAVGVNVFRLVATDASGNVSRDSVVITRLSAGDVTRPVITRRSPVRDTAVPNAITTFTTSWAVTDNVALGAVSINGVYVAGASGIYSRTQALSVGVNRFVIVARDSAGNDSSDSVIVTRGTGSVDTTRPVIVRDSNTRTQTVSNATTSMNLLWTVTDASALTVRLDDSIVIPTAGLYRKVVSLAVGANIFRILATDASGNVSRDSIVITRSSAGDVTPPVISRRTARDTAVPNAITSYTVSWMVTDNVAVSSVLINDSYVSGVGGLYARTMSLAVGANRIAILARDSAGNYSRDSVVVTRGAGSIDTTRPVIARDTNTRSQTVSNATTSISLGWTATDASALTASLNDSVLTGSGNYYRRTVFLAVGANVFRFSATDASGNVSRDSVVVTRSSAGDLTRPVITRRSPGRDTTVSNSTTIFTASWSVTDNVGLSSVVINDYLVTGVGGIYSRTQSLVVGANRFAIYARDSSGNVSLDSVTIVRGAASIDSTRPVIVVDTASRSQTVQNSTSAMNLLWTVTDASALTVRLNDSIVTPTAGLYRKSVSLAVGANIFRIVATDASGNVSRDSVVITRSSAGDLTRPVITRRSPGRDTTVSNSTTSFTASWAVTDNVGVASVSINGVAVTGTAGVYTSTIALVAGVNTVRIVARDAAGNTTTDSVWITKAASSDVTPPTISRSGVPGSPLNIGQNPTASISAYISDNDAVASVTIGGALVVGTYGNYTQAVAVQAGMNTVLIIATDRSGNVARDTIRFEARLYDAYYNSYKIVTIGGKAWMAQNLQIPAAAGSTGACIGGDCANNGRMYTAAQAATVCPAGWHLPTDLDWKSLVTSAAAGSSDTLGASRLRTTSGWTGTNADSSTYSFNGTNTTGFNLAPTDRFVMGASHSLGAFWTSTTASPMAAFGRSFAVGAAVSDATGARTSAAVRCTRN